MLTKHRRIYRKEIQCQCVRIVVWFGVWDKNQTYLQVRWVRDWTNLGWLEVSRTHLASLRETSSHPRCVQSQTHLPASMFAIELLFPRSWTVFARQNYSIKICQHKYFVFLRNISLWKLLRVLKRPNSRACALETIASFLALPVPCIPRPMKIARSREALGTRIELQPVKKGNLKLVPGLSILCDFETWLLKNDLANQETALMFYRQFFVYFSTIQLFFCELAWNFKISISNINLYSNIRNSWLSALISQSLHIWYSYLCQRQSLHIYCEYSAFFTNCTIIAKLCAYPPH
jgi:hypothetical protein